MLQVGDKAPEFKLNDEQGKPHALSGYKGKKVVLYFYPKDDTPGCTKESCDFRDNYKRFLAKGAVLFGVSRDDEASHAKFKKKFDLPFPLLADVDGKATEAYGVWVEKSMYGKNYMGIERSTFVIDASGKIADIVRKVKVDGHAQETLGKL